ncbi:MAG: M28 family peptidase, partial [Myxococcales bacterium]|nr:M28 family peptidase [Myxococcales bacterium]
SVQAGPGASDDGSGVAVGLEIARLLARPGAPRHRNPIVLFFADGEEAGLLGARAFTRHDPLARSVRMVINVEARGTHGPSMMFETNPRNAAMVRLFAEVTPRPVTSSAFYTVYKKLPNDTDFTVFRWHGMLGVNFAYVGGVTRYHTPLDNLAHVSAASLQHHGDHAAAMLRALAEVDPRTLVSAQDAAFFDVLAAFVVRWPLDLTPLLAVLAMLALLAACVLLVRQRRLSLSQLLWGLLVALVALLLPLVLGAGLWLLLHTGGALDGFFPVWAALGLCCFCALALAGATLPWWRRRAGVVGCWLGAWLIWGVASLALALLEPGMAYPALVPTLVAAVLAGAWLGRGAAPSRIAAAAGARLSLAAWAALLLPAAAAALTLLPIAWMLHLALGLVAPPAFTALSSLLLLPLGPLLAWPLHAAPRAQLPRARVRWGLAAVAGALALAAFVFLLTRSPFDARNPQRLSLAYFENADSGRAIYFADGFWSSLPASLRSVARFGAKVEVPFPWAPFYMRKTYVAKAARARLAPPTIEILERSAFADGRRRVRFRLRSPRGARVATLVLPRALRPPPLTIGGSPVLSNGARFTPGFRSFSVRSLPREGVIVEVVLARAARVPLVVVDQKAGLAGARAGRLRAARPAWATPSQDGDISLVARRFEL